MTSQGLRIAVDAMGGDHGPQEVVKGVALAAQNLPEVAHLIVVGDQAQIGRQVQALRCEQGRVSVRHTPHVIRPQDRPAEAYKPDCEASVAVAARLVREGRADACVSIGNTGAAMAAAMRHLGRVKGIDRPAIAAVVPTKQLPTVMLDMGANAECEPNQLLEFAVMGLVYCRRVLGRQNPTVALLSIGEEETKGRESTRQAHKLLKQCVPEFVGNIEAGAAFEGRVDVVVCDGFSGNVMLKCAEGVAALVLTVMNEELTRHPWMKLALLPLHPAMRRLRRRLDYREFGGAPLLGVNGVCIVGHGRSDAVAVSNAIGAAAKAAGTQLVGALEHAIADLHSRKCAVPPSSHAGN